MIKKVLKVFIICLILFTIIITTKSYCTYRTNSQKEYEAINKALEDYLSPYMGEDVDNYERILSYSMGSSSSRGGPWKEGEMITSFSIKFHVEVPDKNNTKWLPYVNVVYMDFDIVDGEYVLKRIFERPDKLDEFEKAFKEYQEKNDEIVSVENEAINAVESNKNSSEVILIRNGIYVISAFVIIVLGVGFIIKMIKKL
jgi:hypothetical protein